MAGMGETCNHVVAATISRAEVVVRIGLTNPSRLYKQCQLGAAKSKNY